VEKYCINKNNGEVNYAPVSNIKNFYVWYIPGEIAQGWHHDGSENFNQIFRSSFHRNPRKLKLKFSQPAEIFI
jgi:hypothetical protein